MNHFLRKTPSHLHLAYKYGEPSGGLLGRNMSLNVDGDVLTLDVDLAGNLKTRNKHASWFVDAINLSRNHHKLKFLQCPDNLVRARLIRAWEQIATPKMRMRLTLGLQERYLYEVSPHSLFMGGIQLDVVRYLDDDEQAPANWRNTPDATHEEDHA